MRALDPETPVGLVAIFHPESVPVLQSVGVDLCLEHDRPLVDACAMRDLDVQAVIDRFAPHREAERAEPLGTRQDVWVPAAYLGAC